MTHFLMLQRGLILEVYGEKIYMFWSNFYRQWKDFAHNHGNLGSTKSCWSFLNSFPQQFNKFNWSSLKRKFMWERETAWKNIHKFILNCSCRCDPGSKLIKRHGDAPPTLYRNRNLQGWPWQFPTGTDWVDLERHDVNMAAAKPI